MLLWQFLNDDLTKFIESHVKNICLLIEKGICILSKLVIIVIIFYIFYYISFILLRFAEVFFLFYFRL